MKANFGETQFVTDLDAMWSDQCDRVVRSLNLTQIESPKVSCLPSSPFCNDRMQSVSSMVAELILDYLVHHRYCKVSAFIEYAVQGSLTRLQRSFRRICSIRRC